MPFEPGKSGNPGGRPKGTGKVRELAREHTEAAIKALVDSLADERLKVSAAQALLDRGWGKPTQHIAGDDESDPINLVHRIERVIVKPENPNG